MSARRGCSRRALLRRTALAAPCVLFPWTAVVARAASPGGHPYYTRRAQQLQQRFGLLLRLARGRLRQLHGEHLARTISRRAQLVFGREIHSLPFVGADNIFGAIIELNGWLISLYRAMISLRLDERHLVRLGCLLADDLFRRMPGLAQGLLGDLLQSDLFFAQLEAAAERSQLRQHPDDWVFTAERPEPGELLLHLTECGVIKYYRARGTMALAPYCNFFDLTYSRHLGLGLDASETIGLGHGSCSMRFRPGQPTQITPQLSGLMPAP